MVDYATWTGLNWSSGAVDLPQQAFGYRLLVKTDVPGTPMYAHRDDQGDFIGYNPGVCSAMGADASLFVLLHELGHIKHGHTDPSRGTDGYGYGNAGRVGRETHADEYACAQAIALYPNDAGNIYTAAHSYFTRTNGDGGGHHPPDIQRAASMEQQWRLRSTFDTQIRFHNDDAFPKTGARSVLAWLGVSLVEQQDMLATIEAKGSAALRGPTKKGWTYAKALTLVRDIKVGCRFIGTPVPPRLIIEGFNPYN
ncbi:M48 family metalloprotease [Sandaracinobacteroides saxicola]|uniref:Uncharacterized protein n=1 Tax=Sandaracinobacteroides saxicola TaxID=2759707 RepID=A0A7G5IJV8_9SPHN|nr:hypothetical protein [Sandaracinobacteroides saxicola]QMW23650.1 hypothetical protein H3309_03935 [Sandaracinobacteroides saxicola]